MDDEIVDYDSALIEYVGQFGKYQILYFLLLGLVEISMNRSNQYLYYVMGKSLKDVVFLKEIILI